MRLRSCCADDAKKERVDRGGQRRVRGKARERKEKKSARMRADPLAGIIFLIKQELILILRSIDEITFQKKKDQKSVV